MKQIELWQWWRTRGGEIVRVVWVTQSSVTWPILIVNKCGLTRCHSNDGSYIRYAPENDLIEHLPDCTGFDWVPEPEYPRWYVDKYKAGVYRRDSLHGFTWLRPYDSVEQMGSATILDSDTFREITPTEAADLLNPKTRRVVLRRWLVWSERLPDEVREMWQVCEPNVFQLQKSYDTGDTRTVEIPL